MIKNKKILIGITGCIGVYKVCGLVNKLQKQGAVVKVIMTKAATEFVTPLTFQTLTHSPVYLDEFNPQDKSTVEHINLADWCDILLIAPCTANTISKIAYGICDNLLTTAICATPQNTPVVLAPAMNVHMWENEIIQQNINSLKKYIVRKRKKYTIVEPIYGDLACGYKGKGKLADNDSIIITLGRVLK